MPAKANRKKSESTQTMPEKKRPQTTTGFEEDCGFVFRRKTPKLAQEAGANNQVSSKPSKDEPLLPKTVATPKKSLESSHPSANPTPMKRNMLERQRRRSSLPGLGLSSSKRRSSIGIGLTHDLPPANVESKFYHKHILPDLPGPVKMRQLLIWAIQKASKEMVVLSKSSKKRAPSSADWEESIAEPMIQALHTNELNTAWYQRPALGNVTTFKPNPANTEMKECLNMYQRYFRQLSNELVKWKSIEQSPSPFADFPSNPMSQTVDVASIFSDDLQSLNKWACRLPLSIDRLGWLLNVYGSFEQQSRTFCEAVFKQIFDRFFAGSQRPKLFTEPIQALRALSSAPSL